MKVDQGAIRRNNGGKKAIRATCISYKKVALARFTFDNNYFNDKYLRNSNGGTTSVSMSVGRFGNRLSIDCFRIRLIVVLAKSLVQQVKLNVNIMIICYVTECREFGFKHET